MPLSPRDNKFKDGNFSVEHWMVEPSTGNAVLVKFAYDAIDDFQSRNGTKNLRRDAVVTMATFFQDVASAKYDRDGLDKSGVLVVRTADVLGFPNIIRKYSPF